MRRLLLSLAAVSALVGSVPAAPPVPPAGFGDPQSPAKPAPFPVRLVDQGKFDPRLKGLLAPDGFRVEVVATDPVVVNPVGMTFAPDGRLFVLEWKPDPGREWFELKETFRYRDGSTRQIATMKKFVMDPVKVLHLNPETGVYDRAETILAEELPSSILYHDGWLYLSGRGTVRRYRQSKPNGPWDVREVIAQGFCGFHHHQVSGMTVGNDGWLYLTSGDDDNFVEGSDGSRATVLRTGAVFRCRLDGSRMETFSVGYRNPYRDLAHDDKYNWFHADNDNEDGSKFTGCRLVHVAEDVDYGWRLKVGARCCRPDFVRGAIAGELPGKLPPMLKTGRGAPAGVLIYHDTRLPERYRGLMYYPDVFRKLVRAYSVVPNGASFGVSHEFEFLKSDDPLFRPCHMVTGPDGAMYVCDWRTDSGGAGKLWGDGKNGRIYRVRWAGTAEEGAVPLRGMDSWAKLLKRPDGTLVDALAALDLTDRCVARNELVRRGEKSRDMVLKRFVSGTLDPDARLTALGVLQAFWNADVEDLCRLLLRDDSPDVRRLAAEYLGRNAKPKDLRTYDALLRASADEEAAVRRAVALALGRIGGEGAADVVVNALKADDAKDPFLTDGYLRAIERLGKPGVDALVALAQSGNDKDLPLALSAFAALRSRPAADAVLGLLANPHLTARQRAGLVRSYSNYQFDPPLSLEPLAVFLAGRPDEPAEVQVAALEVLGTAGGLAGPTATRFVVGLLDAADAEVRGAAVLAVEESRLTAAQPKLLAVAADRRRPAAERIAVLKALRAAGDRQAAPALKTLLAGDEPPAVKLEALRALAAHDNAAARPLAEALLDGPNAALQTEAVVVLGATKAGAKLVAERYLARKLPKQLLPKVSDAAKQFVSDPVMAKLHADVLRGGLMIAATPAEAQKIRELVATKGDPKRGKELYLNAASLSCVSCHRLEGVGGNVGPDLTRVWDTHSVDKLLETILEPNKEIKEGYQTYKAATHDGRVFTGLKVSENRREVVLRDANGRDVLLNKDDVEELVALKTSLMPDNAISLLSFEQFIDLLAFLRSRPTQEALRGTVLEYAVATGFRPELKRAEAAEKDPPPGGTAAGGKDGWQFRPTGDGGVLNLQPLLSPEPAAAYVVSWVHSAKKQSATFTLLADDPVRVWVGDALAFERAGPKRTPGDDGEKVVCELAEGWNPVVVKVVANGGTAHRVGLRWAGDGLRTASKPDGK